VCRAQQGQKELAILAVRVSNHSQMLRVAQRARELKIFH
jgi:hypothetical protein